MFTVYTPIKVGLVHVTASVAVLNVINVVLCPALGVTVALYTMSDGVQILELSINASTICVVPIELTLHVTSVVVLGVIVIEPVDVKQVNKTVSTNIVYPEF
jgi:hypothetical protein